MKTVHAGIEAPSPEPLPASSGCSSTCLALSIALPVAAVSVLAIAALVLLRYISRRKQREAATKDGVQLSASIPSHVSLNQTSQASGSGVVRSCDDPPLSDVRGTHHTVATVATVVTGPAQGTGHAAAVCPGAPTLATRAGQP